MNTATSHSHSKRISRPRFFPASRRTAGIAAVPVAVAHPHAVITGFSYDSVPETTEDFFSQIWTPGLLDRLQAPLTRYRE